MPNTGFIETSIDLSALDVFQDPDRVMALMEPHIDRALAIIQSAVIVRTPSGSGELKRAIGYKFAKDTGVGRVYVSPGLAPAKYAEFVEYGRLPGKMPPFGPDSSLYEWVRRKVTTSHFKATGKVLHKTPDREKMILTISFLIARAIGKKGTYRSQYTPQGSPHMFELGWADSQGVAMDIIATGIAEVLKAL